MAVTRENVLEALHLFGRNGANAVRLAKKVSTTLGVECQETEILPFLEGLSQEDPPAVELQGLVWVARELENSAEEVTEASNGDDKPPEPPKPTDDSAKGPASPPKPKVSAPSDDEAERPELLNRIVAMRQDPNYPSWYVRTGERLEDLSIAILKSILRKGNEGIQLLERLPAHPEHPVFAQVRDQLTKAEVAFHELEEEYEKAKERISLLEKDSKDLPTRADFDKVCAANTLLQTERDGRPTVESYNQLETAHKAGYNKLWRVFMTYLVLSLCWSVYFAVGGAQKTIEPTEQAPTTSEAVEQDEDPFDAAMRQLKEAKPGVKSETKNKGEDQK